MGLAMHNDGFWDDHAFETRREDERAPEWHPWDDKVFEEPNVERAEQESHA